MKIARQFHWEMGHRLPFHAGACRNLHGHSYRLWVELEGECDGNGMLLDYGEMKEKIQPLIEPFDHCFLCDEQDALMREFLDSHRFKALYVPFPTTAENIASHLLGKIWELFRPEARIRSIALRLAETETSYAEISRSREDG